MDVALLREKWRGLGDRLFYEFARRGRDPIMNLELRDDHTVRLRRVISGKEVWIDYVVSDQQLADDLTLLAQGVYAEVYDPLGRSGTTGGGN